MWRLPKINSSFGPIVTVMSTIFVQCKMAYQMYIMPTLCQISFVTQDTNFWTNHFRNRFRNRLKMTFSLTNYTPRGGRFPGFWGTKKKTVVGMVAVLQVKVLAVLCCGRKQLLAPAAKRQNILCICAVFFFPVFIVFFTSFVEFKTCAFLLLFFTVVLRCCFRRVFAFVSPFPRASPVV